MAFLPDQAKQHKSTEFVIPYDRQAPADYPGVERSAMSAEIGNLKNTVWSDEISKLKKSGQIDTKGAWFRIRN